MPKKIVEEPIAFKIPYKSDRELYKPFIYYLVTINKWLIIKKGFRWDGFSIPFFAWSIVGGPFSQKSDIPGLVHDALYSAELFDRDTDDHIFSYEMKKKKFPIWKRYIMWFMVSLFGWYVWNKHKKKTVDYYREYVQIMD